MRLPASLPWLKELLAPGSSKGKILLVDDIPDVLWLFREVLTRQGYEVQTGEDGLQCVNLALTQRPDLILLNFLMPRMDGLTALKKIKSNPITSNLRVVMFSATSDFKWFKRTSFLEGALDCLQSPFDVKTLLFTVEKNLRP